MTDWKKKRQAELRSKARCALCITGLLAITPAVILAADATGSNETSTEVIEQEQTSKPLIRWKQEESTEIASRGVTARELEEEAYYDSLEELAICVEAEAGNQSLEGKRMVVDVILNRVDDPEWPDTIQGVIEQYPQFSSFWDGGMAGVYEPSKETFKAVQMELEERSYPGIYYFTAGGYGEFGTPWKQVEDHFFCTK